MFLKHWSALLYGEIIFLLPVLILRIVCSLIKHWEKRLAFMVRHFDSILIVAIGLQKEDGNRLVYKQLRTVPTIVTAHTFCASRDTRISYR